MVIAREERDILKKSTRHFLVTAQMKYEFMQSHGEEFSVGRMSEMLEVSRSGYYHFTKRTPSQRKKEEERWLMKVKAIYEASRRTYGSPRIHAELQDQRETCSRQRISRLMKKAGIVAKMAKKFKITTKANPNAKAAPNLLEQKLYGSPTKSTLGCGY